MSTLFKNKILLSDERRVIIIIPISPSSLRSFLRFSKLFKLSSKHSSPPHPLAHLILNFLILCPHFSTLFPSSRKKVAQCLFAICCIFSAQTLLFNEKRDYLHISVLPAFIVESKPLATRLDEKNIFHPLNFLLIRVEMSISVLLLQLWIQDIPVALRDCHGDEWNYITC